jgi:hypothetical protein
MEKPALHVVVHHRFDPEKPYDNAWDDDGLTLRQFETTAEVAAECARALGENAWVYVHRCGLRPIEPTVACRARVFEVQTTPGLLPRVCLHMIEVIDQRATRRPARGHNHYYADLPSWSA